MSRWAYDVESCGISEMRELAPPWMSIRIHQVRVKVVFGVKRGGTISFAVLRP